MTERPARSAGPGLLSALLAGAGPGALLVAHPILDLVARHPVFLDAHRLGPAGIVLLALLTTLIPAVAVSLAGAPLTKRIPRLVRLWMTFLAPAVVVVPAVFLLHSDVRSRLHAPETREPVAVSSPAPVVFLVLDELPLKVLLDHAGDIDTTRFPAIARLASISHFFAEARSPYATTLPSVPAILTGRYANRDLLVEQAETCNLFTDLAGTYRLDVAEHVTRLARGIHRPGFVDAPASPAWVIARDLAILYLHRLLPEARSGGLPRVDEAWGSFGTRRPKAGQPGLDPRVRDFVEFIDRLRPPGVPGVAGTPRAPWLHFFHADLPHRPWTLGGDLVSQTRAVDKLLGRLLSRMDEIGLLDRALLVVVADHGLGMTPGAGRRGDPNRRIVFDEILRVPLFVKLPGQTGGWRHDGYVETVDIVPTLADALGFSPSCLPNGRSLFDETRRWSETTFSVHRDWSPDGLDGRTVSE